MYHHLVETLKFARGQRWRLWDPRSHPEVQVRCPELVESPLLCPRARHEGRVRPTGAPSTDPESLAGEAGGVCTWLVLEPDGLAVGQSREGTAVWGLKGAPEGQVREGSGGAASLTPLGDLLLCDSTCPLTDPVTCLPTPERLPGPAGGGSGPAHPPADRSGAQARLSPLLFPVWSSGPAASPGSFLKCRMAGPLQTEVSPCLDQAPSFPLLCSPRVSLAKGKPSASACARLPSHCQGDKPDPTNNSREMILPLNIMKPDSPLASPKFPPKCL